MGVWRQPPASERKWPGQIALLDTLAYYHGTQQARWGILLQSLITGWWRRGLSSSSLTTVPEKGSWGANAKGSQDLFLGLRRVLAESELGMQCSEQPLRLPREAGGRPVAMPGPLKLENLLTAGNSPILQHLPRVPARWLLRENRGHRPNVTTSRSRNKPVWVALKEEPEKPFRNHHVKIHF